jgi:peroxiredoxin
MLGPMKCRAVPFVLAVLGAPISATLPAQRTLAELQQQFAAEARQLDGQQASAEQREQLLARHAGRLEQFLAGTAAGDDRWNGRLMLADLQLARGDRTKASSVLAGIDPDAAPALLLVTAATMAQHLQATSLRDRFVKAALAKDGVPLADRLAMGRLLSTVLHEVERGDELFAKALAEAKDDEQRAFVRWHRADALRDREDLPDNAAYEELEKLAKDLPDTYWGGVARDRLRATQLKAGDEAIDFRATTRDGKTFTLAEQRGKAVVLAFWSRADRDTPSLVATLEELERMHEGQVAVLGICIDRDADATAAAVQQLGIDFPVVADGKGTETDAALRWFVGSTVVHVVDTAGKVARLGLHAGTADGRKELHDAVAGALKK